MLLCEVMYVIMIIINMLACKGAESTEVQNNLREMLGKIVFDGPVPLPTNPTVEVCGIRKEKCKFFDSKKKPLSVCFINADERGDDVYIMYKSEDDIRQDMLTLQMLSIMDQLWQSEGIDLRVIAYNVIATGNEVGLIEMVPSSKTVSHIQKEIGGGSAAAFKDTNISQWLRQTNPSEHGYRQAARLFAQSAAGYCVATYVMGIGVY